MASYCPYIRYIYKSFHITILCFLALLDYKFFYIEKVLFTVTMTI
jgi:hypothetical protein